ncbi:hypothetical protein [uncultured Eubacterium sp.]|uniref:hypothetical protein n=1 Tax=uncultured Eubacterium sp. TaxID=165185 RepID=UPI0025E91593|nr:hypothetical protein [uncultured Eubacterium sp.]
MKRKITTTKVVILSLAESKGFFRGYRLFRLATLVATVGKNSPPDCFLPKAFGFLPPCSNPFSL